MFRINGAKAQIFYSQNPETFKAMQHLVMAMDDFAIGVGKKPFFDLGQDKSVDLMTEVAVHIWRTITAMRTDGIIAPQASAAQVYMELQERLERFFEAFPTWIRARLAAQAIFNDEAPKGIVQTYVEMFPR